MGNESKYFDLLIKVKNKMDSEYIEIRKKLDVLDEESSIGLYIELQGSYMASLRIGGAFCRIQKPSYKELFESYKSSIKRIIKQKENYVSPPYVNRCLLQKRDKCIADFYAWLLEAEKEALGGNND